MSLYSKRCPFADVAGGLGCSLLERECAKAAQEDAFSLCHRFLYYVHEGLDTGDYRASLQSGTVGDCRNDFCFCHILDVWVNKKKSPTDFEGQSGRTSDYVDE